LIKFSKAARQSHKRKQAGLLEAYVIG